MRDFFCNLYGVPVCQSCLIMSCHLQQQHQVHFFCTVEKLLGSQGYVLFPSQKELHQTVFFSQSKNELMYPNWLASWFGRKWTNSSSLCSSLLIVCLFFKHGRVPAAPASTSEPLDMQPLCVVGVINTCPWFCMRIIQLLTWFQNIVDFYIFFATLINNFGFTDNHSV